MIPHVVADDFLSFPSEVFLHLCQQWNIWKMFNDYLNFWTVRWSSLYKTIVAKWVLFVQTNIAKHFVVWLHSDPQKAWVWGHCWWCSGPSPWCNIPLTQRLLALTILTSLTPSPHTNCSGCRYPAQWHNEPKTWCKTHGKCQARDRKA